MDGFHVGFRLGLNRPPPSGIPCKNSSAVRNNLEAVRKLVNKEIQKGHMLIPFDETPCPNLVISPLHIVPKPLGSEDPWRFIHDLAHPYDHRSVSSCIPDSHSSVKYHTLDELLEMALVIGNETWGARVDIKHAFRNQPIHFDDLFALGFKLDGKYFLNSSVPFGAASSCLFL